ncbi:coiled-coil domain-containing protein 187 isoform X4 [Siniperca chuatsi]|uniref:coiled-coil domain-containing protein 187 isoform X4 n=1 Tax=Siniperca chuatsi TaxID=119488 RepID=UPI001CE20244|nr:coiled-coil domain-containing protein 187 isoform X4 [Siniperca chuatsi]
MSLFKMNLEASHLFTSSMTPSSESSAMCQCFAVLEDGVLAHNLQEQEIEQYYTTNIEKNQLVQNDIRVAKRLQDEEEEQQAQQSALLRQASRQLEEQDFEYARVIQEEIQRCAEEAQRREKHDEEIAKRMQEEENQRRRRRSRGQEGHSEGSASDPALPSPYQHTLSSLHQGEEQYSSTTTRWQCSTSHHHSELTEPQADSPRGVAAQKNTASWSNQGHTDSFREIRSELREPLSEDSEDSDTVFSEQLSVLSQRLNERLITAPHRRRASLHQPQERNYRSLCTGTALQPEHGEASLDLGELRQVLQDEELAHKLQEEEEQLLRRNSQPSPCSAYPEGDFRVAQVAQDEEIARFMQKQEIKSKRRSRELEGPASWREHRTMISHHDRQAARDRQGQRERLDSEGLPSPTEDCSPENQSPSLISTLPQAQQIRNIAEELDPTFQARRQDIESLRVRQTGPTCQSLPMPHSSLRDLLEEPTFIPPTKRQTDKSGRTKPKEKKENCKQQ